MMMSRKLLSKSICALVCLLLSFSGVVQAQVNYLSNGGFEVYSRCPYSINQIKFATGWTCLDTIDHPPADSFGTPCAPEFCHECAIGNGYSGVPTNQDFYDYPHSGKGMVQVMMYNSFSNPSAPYRRDYLQGKLSKPLISGRKYCVTFYVLLAQYSQYAVNHIAAYLDDGSIDTTSNCGLPQTTHTPQIVETKVITDTNNWIKIEGIFIASGTELYITIGNYANDNNLSITTNANSGTGNALYLIDDVSVVESNLPASAGGDKWIAKGDSVFIGRNEIVPDCEWYRNGVLIDTVNAGLWVHDTVNTTYLVKQSICGNVQYDSMHVYIANEGVTGVGNESIFKISPNPATNEIVIQAPNNKSEAQVTIYDMGGRQRLQQQVSFTHGEAKLSFSLFPGIYTMIITNEGGRRSVQRLSVM